MKADADGARAMLLASEPPQKEEYRVVRDVNSPRINKEALLAPAGLTR